MAVLALIIEDNSPSLTFMKHMKFSLINYFLSMIFLVHDYKLSSLESLYVTENILPSGKSFFQ